MLTGYSDVSLSGDGASDLVLRNLSERVGACLRKLKLLNSSTATDIGLRALMSQGVELQHVHLEELAKVSSGKPNSIFEMSSVSMLIHHAYR